MGREKNWRDWDDPRMGYRGKGLSLSQLGASHFRLSFRNRLRRLWGATLRRNRNPISSHCNITRPS